MTAFEKYLKEYEQRILEELSECKKPYINSGKLSAIREITKEFKNYKAVNRKG